MKKNKAKKPVKKAPATVPPKNPNLDTDGREVRAGSIICADGPTYGRVVVVMGGVLIFRPYKGEGFTYTTEFLTDNCEDVTVVDDGPVGGIGREAADAYQIALDAVRIAGRFDAFATAVADGPAVDTVLLKRLSERVAGLEADAWDMAMQMGVASAVREEVRS